MQSCAQSLIPVRACRVGQSGFAVISSNFAALPSTPSHRVSRPCGTSSSHSSSRGHWAGDFGLAARRSAKVRLTGVTMRPRPLKDGSTTEPAATASASAMVSGIERTTDPPERRRVATQRMTDEADSFSSLQPMPMFAGPQAGAAFDHTHLAWNVSDHQSRAA